MSSAKTSRPTATATPEPQDAAGSTTSTMQSSTIATRPLDAALVGNGGNGHALAVMTAPVMSLPSAPLHGAVSAVSFDAERLRILADTIMPGATPAELDFFKLVCQRTGLDPFARQIHAVKRGGYEGKGAARRWVDKWVYQVAIDGFRLIAERTGKYRGQEVPLFCADDERWVEVWLSLTPPRACKVGVLRADFDQPLYAVALWTEYVQTKNAYDDSGDAYGGQRQPSGKVPTAMWASKPCIMLAKVAEALALRKAFPQELSGIYSDDEMAQADNATGDDAATMAEHTQRRTTASRTQRTQRAARATATATTTVAATADHAAGGATTTADDAADPGWINGTARVYPFGAYKTNGITLDARYVPGATRIRKSDQQRVDVGGEYVISTERLEDAIVWASTKLNAHSLLEADGQTEETGGPGFLSSTQIDFLIALVDDVKDEITERATRDVATPADAEGEQRPRPTDGPTASGNGPAPAATTTTTTPAPNGTSAPIATASAPVPATTTTTSRAGAVEHSVTDAAPAPAAAPARRRAKPAPEQS